MTRVLPDIDFHQIRPYGQPPSRPSGFEELASILIEEGVIEWPVGVRFDRFGNPDGGREGRGVLPNGDVWAWQAKYLFEFDASAAGQVTHSVRRAVGREPNLKRYFVTMPFDMPAGDTEERRSANTRWAESVAEWETLAREKGLAVEFVFVGAHLLVTALTEPRHAGRARYWLDAQVMTPEWQGRRLEETIAKAGRRYSPRLNVEIEATQALEAVGRTDAYVARWQQVLADIREARRWSWRAPANVADEFAEALPECVTALDRADAALVEMIAAARSADGFPQVEDPLGDGAQAVQRVSDLLHEHCLSKDGYFVGDAASLYSNVRQALSAIWRGKKLARAAVTHAAREKVLLLVGRAGVGKTHLLCDAAVRRIAEGRPTVLLLGQDFDNGSLLSQMSDLTQLGGSLDDVLAVLDSSAEAVGCIGLFMIDALNESERPERWRDDSRTLLASAVRWPHVSLVLSCRTEFVEAVIGDGSIATVEHVGFAEATDVAVRRFSQEYGLEPPTFPVLNPEFGNPLFLKLTCEALETLGAARFPFGAAGLTTVCGAFLEAVNKRLSEPGRCDYDEHTDLVSRVVQEVALLGHDPVDRSEVKRITNEALPDHSWSRSLMRGLLTEGVLMELGDDRITFGYQRVGDVARAAAIAEKTPEEMQAWLRGLGNNFWREHGVLGALAVIYPERHGVELVDLAVNSEGEVSPEMVDHFLGGLLLRSPESVSPRTIEIVQRLLDQGYQADEVWDHLIRVACIPGHPLNADWLHGRLAGYGVAERDRLWSTWLVGSADIEESTAVRRLIEWAWPSDLSDRSSIPDDVAILATELFGWFLTTSDRRVRDRSTKALVSVAERAPAAFATAIGRFRGTNDPYVVERLAAAACGAVHRTDDPMATQLIANGVAELVSDAWPLHLLTRDFVRRVNATARSRGWPGEEALPPYDAEWPIATRSATEIEALAGPPGYEYGSIWYSLTGMGDFGRYVMEPALQNVATEDEESIQHEAERAVFDRALSLGWTPELFLDIDRSRRGGDRQDRVVERVGKKYQWIGFYEALGRIADHQAIKQPWGEEEPRLYAYAEQLVSRDIDPTVLVRKPEVSPVGQAQWFSPMTASFPVGITEDYPVDMAGVPDPMGLITVTDPAGVPWLVLESNPSWEQPLPPEIEALRPPRLAAWMKLRAYLVPMAAAAALHDWAKDQDWSGGWMPESADVYNVLLGSHPGDPEWSAADGGIEWWDPRAHGFELLRPLECVAWYGGTGGSRDKSAEDETRGYVPTREMFNLLGLSNGVDFAWRDRSGVAVLDPSVLQSGPSCLVMRRDLLSRLADAGFALFWTALIEKQLQRSDDPMPHDDYRWVTASASYSVDDGRIEQVAARALRCRPGPSTEYELAWAPRRRED
jgi:hypothetical protein